MGQKPSIEMTIIDMRLKSRELVRLSNRSAREEKAEKFKVKEAIRKNNKEGARIFAQNAIRKKHESLSYLQLSSKLDAVASRLDTAYRSQQMTNEIHKAVPRLAAVMNSLDVTTLCSGLNKFERLFEDLDVRADYVSTAIDSTTASSTPIDSVDQLIIQVAEEHALDLENMLDDPAKIALANKKQSVPSMDQSVDPIEERLRNL